MVWARKQQTSSAAFIVWRLLKTALIAPRRLPHICVTVVWLALVSNISLADQNVQKVQEVLAKADTAYGEYLSGQCVTCHHATGESTGIPAIMGLPADYLVMSMLDYRNSAQGRTNPAMVNIAKNLSDEELGSLAQFFSEQKSN